ncbi:MAG: hypothetical protein D6692_00585 [Planctomycetota bacterium]|nr:MAG: hypothetical protein D6692_00585 [Planctomycetota bacterium]
MNLAQFLEHWSIVENPFRGEEARTDTIFARMGIAGGGGGDDGSPGRVRLVRPSTPETHAEFDKIIGELDRPSTSIVFGEKGSGKTAIRLQIADRVARYNDSHADGRVLLIPYDDLNIYLDHYVRITGADKKGDPFAKVRLVDHLDAIVSIGVGRIVNAILVGAENPPPAPIDDAVRRAKKMSIAARRELLLLQALYDINDTTGARTTALRRILRLNGTGPKALTATGVWIGWMPAVALFVWGQFIAGFSDTMRSGLLIASGVLLLMWLLLVLKVTLVDRLVDKHVAQRVARQVRMVPRLPSALAASLGRLDRSVAPTDALPVSGSEEIRYAMLARLQRVARELGFSTLLVLMDRVDEPTLVRGDPERMRSLVWPMLSHKFLQHDGMAVKMLLPIELRHALFKESSAFFQEARLDKQNLVERLSWTGAMLYDLCNARLAACRPVSAEPISLVDLFTEDVTRQDLVDALDHMQQPRDAFKFLYRCLTEHCASVTGEDGAWRIPKHTLEVVRKAEADRVMGLQRGIRPA